MSNITDEELLHELKKRFQQNKRTLTELNLLNEQLLSVNKKLAESEALKSHFISHITNELVNPFASILALTKNMLGMTAKDWDKMRSMIAHIHAEAFSLDFQLKNIFAAARLEAGEAYPLLVSTNINSLTEAVKSDFDHELREKNLNLQIEFLPENPGAEIVFLTDAEKLRLVVANLLSNAIKYSHFGGQINIKVEEKEPGLVICVVDNGAGISPENLDIIFDRFQRCDSGINSINRGHGLGLSVTKAYLDLLEGQIDVQTEKEQYSRFTITIPQNPDQSDSGLMEDDGLFFEKV